MALPIFPHLAKPVKLIVLDRDGVINEDSDAYVKSLEEWIPIPGSIKAIAFRAADSDWGQALLAAHPGTRMWLAGRAKVDTWANTPRAELHLEDAAFIEP